MMNSQTLQLYILEFEKHNIHIKRVEILTEILIDIFCRRNDHL